MKKFYDIDTNFTFFILLVAIVSMDQFVETKKKCQTLFRNRKKYDFLKLFK